jgi:hypothetical protein
MAKQGGLGDALYVGGYDLSGDIQSLGGINGGPAALDFTTIDKSAMARQGGLRDGALEFTSYFDDATGASHPRLSLLPTADQIVTYCRGTSLGSPAACINGKQINYDGSRGNDGSFTLGVQVQANGYGLEWGVQLTAGQRTDTSATSPATGVDTTASAAFGGQAYLQVFSFTGTSVTAKIQDSADNSSFADISPSLVFTAATGVTTQRISVANDTTIRRYVRVITSGTFTSAVFSVVLVKNENAGVLF